MRAIIDGLRKFGSKFDKKRKVFVAIFLKLKKKLIVFTVMIMAHTTRSCVTNRRAEISLYVE